MTATNSSNTKISQRSKRLRKKLYLEEFATFGFELECKFKDDLSDDTLRDFIDAFFIDALTPQGLGFGGGLSSKRLSGFITAQKRYDSVTESQKQELATWLQTKASVASVELSEIMDANRYFK